MNRNIVALAGRPAHTYRHKTFIIMVWNHNHLADLGGPADQDWRRPPTLPWP